MAAVLMLVFKDTILGFVASIQLSANNMVNLGDWISMPKYNADGDVIDISLNTVKGAELGQDHCHHTHLCPGESNPSTTGKGWSNRVAGGSRRAINIDMSSALAF